MPLAVTKNERIILGVVVSCALLALVVLVAW
jgi:hypothetical protein